MRRAAGPSATPCSASSSRTAAGDSGPSASSRVTAAQPCSNQPGAGGRRPAEISSVRAGMAGSSSVRRTPSRAAMRS
jgi:hypothetical protein